MDTAARYSELFARPERTPESFWTSLRYFNLYRIAVAALFLTLTAVYGDALSLGSHQLGLASLWTVPLRRGRLSAERHRASGGAAKRPRILQPAVDVAGGTGRARDHASHVREWRLSHGPSGGG